MDVCETTAGATQFSPARNDVITRAAEKVVACFLVDICDTLALPAVVYH